MEEPRVKRTDRHKKKTLGGYWANIRVWNTRGKSSKELKEMVEDVKCGLKHQLVRIRKLKYVIQCYKEQDKTKQLITQKLKTANKLWEKKLITDKLKRREVKIDNLDGEIGELELTIKQQQKEIDKLNREVDKRDEKLTEVRSRKARGYTRTVKVPLSEEAKRIERIANNGVPTKAVNNLEYITRTALFLTEKKLTIDYLALITRAEILGNVKSKDLGVSYRVLTKLTNLGYLNVSSELKGAAKYWYVSLEGKKLIKDYKNRLSYGASILTQ